MSVVQRVCRMLPERAASVRPRNGQILVMFALMVTVFAGMLSLAIDVGYAYSQRRTVQNAADAAAMAGARMVAKWTADNPTSAQTEAQTVATMDTNRIASTEQTLQSCEYVDYAGSSQGACSATVPANATGVRVVVEEVHPTWFIQAIPGAPESVMLEATATAHVERFSDYPSDAPFIFCASGAWVVAEPDGTPIDLSPKDVLSGDKIDPQWIGYRFAIHDEKLAKEADDCGAAGKSFKGWANSPENRSRTTPNWFAYSPGNRIGASEEAVLGVQGCAPGVEIDCLMFLPFATHEVPSDAPPESSSGSIKEMWVLGFAPFLIKATLDGGHGRHDGILLDEFITVGEGTTDWCRDCEGTVVVRLTD